MSAAIVARSENSFTVQVEIPYASSMLDFEQVIQDRFTLSLLKQHPGRQSLVMKRRSCGWSDAFLMEVVTGSTR